MGWRIRSVERSWLRLGSIFSLAVITLFLSVITPLNAALDDDVSVEGSVFACQLEFTVRPQNRIPPSGNWDTTVTVQIRNSSNTLVGTVTANTNTLGVAVVNLCALGINLTGGTYSFRIRGTSHLWKLYPGYASFQLNYTNLDFTPMGDLLAGETSNVFDNKINSLDISTQVRNLYTNSNKNDLNQDSIVNSLDISGTANNFYKTGD